MSNTSTEACELAYRMFRQNPMLSQSDINRKLADRGYQGVSDRTWRHFRRLRQHGYTTYVPINVLDVQLAHPFR